MLKNLLYYDNIKYFASGRYHKTCDFFIRCENVARLVKIKNPIAYFFLKFLEIFNFLWRKRTFPPPSKIPQSKSQPKKNPKISQQKSQSPNPNPIYLSSFLPLQPHTVALYQYLRQPHVSPPSKISTSKIQKLSKNIKKLSNIDNKNVTILPRFWGFSPFKHPKTAISCHFPWLLTHSLAPCVLSLLLASK